jgi:hypothetical protein
MRQRRKSLNTADILISANVSACRVLAEAVEKVLVVAVLALNQSNSWISRFTKLLI